MNVEELHFYPYETVKNIMNERREKMHRDFPATADEAYDSKVNVRPLVRWLTI